MKKPTFNSQQPLASHKFTWTTHLPGHTLVLVLISLLTQQILFECLLIYVGAIWPSGDSVMGK